MKELSDRMDVIRPQLANKPRSHPLRQDYAKLQKQHAEWDKIGENSVNWLARRTTHSNKRYGDRVNTQSKLKQ